MAETRPGPGIEPLEPPKDQKNTDKQLSQKRGRGNLTLVDGAGKDQPQSQQLSAEEKQRVKLPLGARIALLRQRLVSSALTGARRGASALKPTGIGVWILFALVSLLIFFGSLQFAGVFNPGMFVAGTVTKARKIDVRDKLKGKTQRAVEITKGGIRVIAAGLSQLKKIPAFFAASYQNYKAWKKEREKDKLAQWNKKLRFDQQKINQDKEGLNKQRANLLKQEDEIKSEKIKSSQEEQRLIQFREELKKKEKELIKKQPQKEEKKVTEKKNEGGGTVAAGAENEAPKENLAKIERLADIYKNMPPDQAAEIVKEMDDDLVLAIFEQMKEKNVARIMAEMEPQKAAKLSKKMSVTGGAEPPAAASKP